MIDEVASPCTSVCALDDDNVCLGCFRTVKEITDWWQLSNSRKEEVLKACQQRRQESGWVL